jgi:hypothetical protein
MTLTSYLVILLLDGMPHVIAEHQQAQSCRVDAAQRNERARTEQRFVCVTWTRRESRHSGYSSSPTPGQPKP